MMIRPPLRHSEGSGHVGNGGRTPEKSTSVEQMGGSRSKRPRITSVASDGSLLGHTPVGGSLARLFGRVRRLPVPVDCSGDEVGIH